MEVVIAGSAGSGKSTLISKFGDFLIQKGYSVTRANFDPACEYLPYNPDFDIRNYISLEEIISKEKLGPNAAIIRAYEEMQKIDFDFRADFTLIDTAGQIEVFLLRDTGEKFVSKFRNPVVLLLNSAEFLKAKDYPVLKLIAHAITLKLNTTCIPIVSKADIQPKIIKEMGIFAEFMDKLDMLMKEFSIPVREIRVSSFTLKGFEELLDVLYEVKCACGDLT